jgi:hypothetical protein
MDWLLPADAEPRRIVDFVLGQGIAVLPNYIHDQTSLRHLRREALAAVGASDLSYNFGQAARFPGIPTMPNIAGVLNESHLKEILKLSKKKLVETYITREYKADAMERNGYLHYDRLHTFKLFFYLSDVDERSGPFRAVMGTHGQMREIRIAEWARTKDYAEIRNRPPIDFPELGYTEDDGDPVLGPAGTLIVFDTDTLHKGGLVEKGQQRLVLRTHSR